MRISEYADVVKLRLYEYERGLITDEEFWNTSSDAALEVLAARAKAKRNASFKVGNVVWSNDHGQAVLIDKINVTGLEWDDIDLVRVKMIDDPDEVDFVHISDLRKTRTCWCGKIMPFNKTCHSAK